MLTCITSRFKVLYNAKWVQAFDIWMVGSVSSSQLSVCLFCRLLPDMLILHSEFKWRSPDGFRVVPAYWLRNADHIFLCHVLRCPSCPQATSRWRKLRQEVRFSSLPRLLYLLLLSTGTGKIGTHTKRWCHTVSSLIFIELLHGPIFLTSLRVSKNICHK